MGVTCQVCIYVEIETKHYANEPGKKKIRDNVRGKRRSMEDGTDTQISLVPIFLEMLPMLKNQRRLKKT